MTELEPGTMVAAASASIPLTPLPDAQVESGAPLAGAVVLTEHNEVEIGVWGHTPGVSTDVEVDEVFVVLAGRARIEMLDPAGDPLEVGPGDVASLTLGQRTRWTVTETLRKIYIV